MRETFVKVQYVVCWAGCNLPTEDRTFNSWQNALEMYNKNQDKLSLRIEEYTTITKVKIVLPENIRK